MIVGLSHSRSSKVIKGPALEKQGKQRPANLASRSNPVQGPLPYSLQAKKDFHIFRGFYKKEEGGEDVAKIQHGSQSLIHLLDGSLQYEKAKR